MDDCRTSVGRAAVTRQDAVLTVWLLHASGMELYFASLPNGGDVQGDLLTALRPTV
jgi:hypothetical protein